MNALMNLLQAIENVLETMTYPERLSPSDPVCTIHPDAMAALEEAYDQFMDGADLDSDEGIAALELDVEVA